jgi:pantothenate kinase
MAQRIIRPDDLVSCVEEMEQPPGRPLMVALAGPPGVGKSTTAAALVERLRASGLLVALLPMDGFHLADPELRRLGRSDRKGAPDTFDAEGLIALLERIRRGPASTVWAPEFDRSAEAAIAGSIAVEPGVSVVVVEGNYLLHDDGPWKAVAELFDLRAYLQPADDRARITWLIARHVAHGRTADAARAWVMRSDEANARVVERTAGRADLRVTIAC